MSSSNSAIHSNRVCIIGAGYVGATFAYSLLYSNCVSEIVLIDVAHEKAVGEAMDLSHSVPLLSSGARVWAGEYSDIAGADIVVITAGAKQRPGEDRTSLAARNFGIMKTIVPEIMKHLNSTAVIVVASNPVDSVTHTVLKLSGLPSNRVIGSGTVLDSARLRHQLGEYLGVDSRSVHVHIIGEHGDTEVSVFSSATIAGMNIKSFAQQSGKELTDEILQSIHTKVVRSAGEIIERKGATYYAIGAALVKIIEALLLNKHVVLPVSTVINGPYGLEDVCLSLPSVVNSGGVQRVLEIPLNETELAALHKSANAIKNLARDTPSS